MHKDLHDALDKIIEDWLNGLIDGHECVLKCAGAVHEWIYNTTSPE